MRLFSIWARDEGTLWHHIYTASRRDLVYRSRLSLAEEQFGFARELPLSLNEFEASRLLETRNALALDVVAEGE